MIDPKCCRVCDLEFRQQEINQADGFIQVAMVDQLEMAKKSLRFCPVCQKAHCARAEDHRNSCTVE